MKREEKRRNEGLRCQEENEGEMGESVMGVMGKERDKERKKDEKIREVTKIVGKL